MSCEAEANIEIEGMDVKKQKIMIVDDTPSNISVLGEVLKDEYEIFISTNGQSALEKVAANPPDLILLDITMPGMDGYEVCRRLKQNQDTRKIPVIFISGKNAEEDEIKGFSVGAVDYITKPFRIPIVKARIKTHMELKRKTDLLESISSRDGLTGIFNRRKFDTVLAAEWNRALRSGQPIAVMLLDIDFFKLYNDNYGHLSGDECLKAVAQTLSAALQRATDFAARYGGEEFVIVLSDTEPEKALLVAEKIRQAIADLRIEHLYSTAAPHITVSLGVASTVPIRNMDYNILLEIADNALYEAKQSGRNTVKQRLYV